MGIKENLYAEMRPNKEIQILIIYISKLKIIEQYIQV
jgi:hypothetical protein